MTTSLYQVDAFASRPFAGNPAAVCILDREGPDDWKQAVAEEMNLSETAFARPMDAAAGRWALQWFTPAAEVELCGHATLVTAHVLWATGRAAPDTAIAFETRFSGTLTCRRGEDGWIAMDFPADPPKPADLPDGLAAALGATAVRSARSRYDWLLELADAEAVRAVSPDWARLAAFETRGVLITAAGDRPGVDVISRFFAPRLRIHEDPVTGSAHCVLGPYWSDRLGKRTLACHQASARGGDVRVTLSDRGDRVELAGQAVTVFEATLAATMP